MPNTPRKKHHLDIRFLLALAAEAACCGYPKKQAQWHLQNTRPDREACYQQEADDDEGREEVAQPLRPQENPREVPVFVEAVVPAHLQIQHTNITGGGGGRRRNSMIILIYHTRIEHASAGDGSGYCTLIPCFSQVTSEALCFFKATPDTPHGGERVCLLLFPKEHSFGG